MDKPDNTSADAAHDIRKGQVVEFMSREAFRTRFRARFFDPAFRKEDASIDRLEAIAWDAYCQARKAPVTEKAGAGAADPDYDLSVEWRQARDAVHDAARRHDDPNGDPRVLLVMVRRATTSPARARCPSPGALPGWRVLAWRSWGSRSIPST